jgi:hypothetical protein
VEIIDRIIERLKGRKAPFGRGRGRRGEGRLYSGEHHAAFVSYVGGLPGVNQLVRAIGMAEDPSVASELEERLAAVLHRVDRYGAVVTALRGEQRAPESCVRACRAWLERAALEWLAVAMPRCCVEDVGPVTMARALLDAIEDLVRERDAAGRYCYDYAEDLILVALPRWRDALLGAIAARLGTVRPHLGGPVPALSPEDLKRAAGRLLGQVRDGVGLEVPDVDDVVVATRLRAARAPEEIYRARAAKRRAAREWVDALLRNELKQRACSLLLNASHPADICLLVRPEVALMAFVEACHGRPVVPVPGGASSAGPDARGLRAVVECVEQVIAEWRDRNFGNRILDDLALTYADLPALFPRLADLPRTLPGLVAVFPNLAPALEGLPSTEHELAGRFSPPAWVQVKARFAFEGGKLGDVAGLRAFVAQLVAAREVVADDLTAQMALAGQSVADEVATHLIRSHESPDDLEPYRAAFEALPPADQKALRNAIEGALKPWLAAAGVPLRGEDRVGGAFQHTETLNDREQAVGWLAAFWKVWLDLAPAGLPAADLPDTIKAVFGFCDRPLPRRPRPGQICTACRPRRAVARLAGRRPTRAALAWAIENHIPEVARISRLGRRRGLAPAPIARVLDERAWLLRKADQHGVRIDPAHRNGLTSPRLLVGWLKAAPEIRRAVEQAKRAANDRSKRPPKHRRRLPPRPLVPWDETDQRLLGKVLKYDPGPVLNEIDGHLHAVKNAVLLRILNRTFLEISR